MTPEQARRLVVLSGPTAVGKGTVVTELRRRYPQVYVSVSVTTRQPRRGEVEGKHYFFVDDAEFDQLIETSALLEWARVHNSARYGTPQKPVMEAIAAGQTVLLEIDLQGARQIRRNWPGAHFVFLHPPSWDELVRRLTRRGTETPAQQEQRLRTAKSELAAADEFESHIVNDDVGRAADALVALLGLSTSDQPIQCGPASPAPNS